MLWRRCGGGSAGAWERRRAVCGLPQHRRRGRSQHRCRAILLIAVAETAHRLPWAWGSW